MTEQTIAIGADPRWVPLSLDGEVDADAEATAREVLRIRGEDSPVTDRLEHVTALLAGLAHRARAAADEDDALAAAFAFMPEQEPVPLAIATLRVTASADSLDTAVDLVVAPPEERYDDPVVEPVSTPLGSAARVGQRLVAGDGRVSEWLGYVWHLPAVDRTVVLSTTFFDLVEAARWGDAFDDLARVIELSGESA